MNPYIFKRKDEPIAIINLTEDGSIVNYKLNSKYERYICGIKQKNFWMIRLDIWKNAAMQIWTVRPEMQDMATTQSIPGM